MKYIFSFSIVRFLTFCLLMLYPACTSCESDHCAVTKDSVIGVIEERDLELINSSDHSQEGVFLSKLNTTATSFGKERFITHVKNPINDIHLLKMRQAQLAFMLDNPELLKQIKKILADIKRNEQGLLYFLDPVKNPLIETTLESFYFQSNWCKDLNNYPVVLDIRNYTKYLGLFGPVFEHLILHFALEYAQEKISSDKGNHDCSKHHHNNKHKHKHHHHHDHNHTCIAHMHLSDNSSVILKGLLLGFKVGHFALHAMSIKEMFDSLASQKAVINQLYQHVASARACLNDISKLFALIKEHNYQPEVFGLSGDNVDFISTLNSENPLKILLQDDAFEGIGSIGIFSRIGKTLSYYRLLENESVRLKSLMPLIGDIDCLVSMSEWYNKVNDKNKRACFVNFITDSSTPVLALQDFWNVAFDCDEAVSNNIEFGTNPSTIILTGPNKAGKSSILKAIGFNIILAQTFGIAAAVHVEMSVFSKLITHITIFDDIRHDTSMMVAEMIRVTQTLQTLNMLKNTELACVLIDDSLFKGTTSEKGQDLAYTYIKKLGSILNCCSLIATHVPILTMLEDENNTVFKNYCIELSSDAQGNSVSTFLLKEGRADNKEVFNILKSQGLNLE